MTGGAVRHYVTSADGTKISVSITGTRPPLVVSPGSLATAEDWQFVADAELAEIPGQAHYAHVFDAAAMVEKIAEFAL